jgi:mannan endo-1,4-beta-mannosidase
MYKVLLLFIAALRAIAQTSDEPTSQVKDALTPAINSIFPNGSNLTTQILRTFLDPTQIVLKRNSPVYRDGKTLKLQGERWTASGANVYWLGLDENVVPPAGAPYYAPLQASYPTKGRITEAMATLVTMGARLIRSQTLGVSVGNPLSLMPALGVYNDAAFDSMDWSIFQARQHGLRIIPPLIDDYV